MSEKLASTEALLHPRQVAELKEEKASIEGMLRAPEYVRSQLQDGGAGANKRIRDIERTLAQAPKPIPPEQVDDAVRLEADLRSKWTAGMPTQAEMRRNAAGCVDKHMAWEKRNKTNVLQWKNLRRRMHASGMSSHNLAEENDISNIEMFRPVGGSQELNMHNEQIPGKIMYMPEKITQSVVLNDDDDAFLKKHDPQLHSEMALMSNESRAKVLDLIHELRNSVPSPPAPVKEKKSKKPGRRAISDEERTRRREHMKTLNEMKRKADASPAPPTEGA